MPKLSEKTRLRLIATRGPGVRIRFNTLAHDRLRKPRIRLRGDDRMTTATESKEVFGSIAGGEPASPSDHHTETVAPAHTPASYPTIVETEPATSRAHPSVVAETPPPPSRTGMVETTSVAVPSPRKKRAKSPAKKSSGK